ncbi:hypothetical protein [Deinococcus knuensis]|uniref:Phage tail assembly protein n=1 Tax=Deinococcus knuensis TaxID=1837380 RepID=A0ABQ2SDH6_9DEIO|nr:hypothetical protein [Deinococcus knuensis]GGS22343.1 hypothetical protein GCM10008961_12290 [Deinococcus knuensis]
MNELTFMLPAGLHTSDGQVHRGGVMRLATALDEIEPLGDPRVQRNEAYYPLLLLARVITRLGPFSPVTPDVLGVLPAADFAYLQSLYAQMNTAPTLALPPQSALPAAPPTWNAAPTPAFPDGQIETECPHCGAILELDLSADLEQGVPS